MPLARIISRSHEYCRELAVDLLARGYTVEIVSPDRIPDNFADLELRVESDTRNDVTASVAVHDGRRSTSLDFVHHLSAPMGDFVRRPPTMEGVSAALLKPIHFNIEQSPTQEVAAPVANAQPSTANPVLKPLAVDVSVPVAAKQKTAQSVENASPFARKRITIVLHRSPWVPKINFADFARAGARVSQTALSLAASTKERFQNLQRPSGRSLRAVGALAAVVAIVIALVSGIRRGETAIPTVSAGSTKAATQNLGSSSGTDVGRTPAGDARRIVASVDQKKTAMPVLPGSAASTARKPKPEGSLAKDLPAADPLVFRDKAAGTATTGRREKTRHQHRDDTVAKDTVTYLDKGFAPGNRSH